MKCHHVKPLAYYQNGEKFTNILYFTENSKMYTLNSPCITLSGLYFCDNGLMISHSLKTNTLFNKNVAFVSICYHSDPDQMPPEAGGKALLLTPGIKI